MTAQRMYSILIVDDNPNNLFTLRTLLENSLDAEVIEAQGGFVALEKISEYKIDLILLDIQMPEINGFEVAKLIRNRPKFRDIPIIFLTAVYKSEEFRQQGLETGAIDYLTKPIDEAILLSRVKAYLRVIEGERTINRQLSEVNDRLQQEIDARTRAEAELERLNQQLQKASQHKTDFLSSMSHEIRTPLNALIGYLSLSLNSLTDTLPTEELQNLIKANQTARVVLQLINDVLDFSKIEAGKMEVFVEEIDLAEITEDVAVTAEGLLLDKPVELRADIDDDLPMVYSDYTKIKQMLNNMVGNAIKFTSEGHVTVRAKPFRFQMHASDPDGVRIEVEDTGDGIPQEKIGTVFESFKQVDSSIKKKFGGTGLGMAITKQFCDMLGIDIGIESEVGKGSLFWLNIPIRAHIGNISPDERPVETGDPRKEKTPEHDAFDDAAPFRTVLVVDDEEMNLQVVGYTIQDAGYTLYTASSAQEGIQLAQDKLPDVILMDLSMPEMDGLEATQLLKQNPVTADIVVIACSAHVTQEMKERSFQAGCAGFISRPITPRRLIERIKTIVQGVRQESLADKK